MEAGARVEWGEAEIRCIAPKLSRNTPWVFFSLLWYFFFLHPEPLHGRWNLEQNSFSKSEVHHFSINTKNHECGNFLKRAFHFNILCIMARESPSACYHNYSSCCCCSCRNSEKPRAEENFERREISIFIFYHSLVAQKSSSLLKHRKLFLCLQFESTLERCWFSFAQSVIILLRNKKKFINLILYFGKSFLAKTKEIQNQTIRIHRNKKRF